MIFVWALAISGLVLIFLEFFLPGAIMAVGGAILLMTSLFVFHMIYEGIGALLLYLLILAAAVFLVIRIALMRVRSASSKGTVYLDTDQEGFQACIYPKELIGRTGIAATDLKPSGHILVDDRPFQALSKTGYIDKDTPIQILGGQGSHLIVKILKDGIS